MHGARPAPTKDSSLCSTTDTFVLLLLYFHSHRSSLTGWHIKYRLIQTHYCISRAEQRHTFPCIRLYCLPLLSTVYFTSLHSITTTTFVVAASFSHSYYFRRHCHHHHHHQDDTKQGLLCWSAFQVLLFLSASINCRPLMA